MQLPTVLGLSQRVMESMNRSQLPGDVEIGLITQVMALSWQSDISPKLRVFAERMRTQNVIGLNAEIVDRLTAVPGDLLPLLLKLNGGRAKVVGELQTVVTELVTTI